MFEARFLDHKRLHVRLEVAIIDRQAQGIQPQRGQKTCIILLEKILQEAIKEELVLLFAQHSTQRFALALLVGRVAGDKIFHVHPAAQAEATQHDGLSLTIHNPRTIKCQNLVCHYNLSFYSALLAETSNESTKQLTAAKDVEQNDRYSRQKDRRHDRRNIRGIL